MTIDRYRFRDYSHIIWHVSTAPAGDAAYHDDKATRGVEFMTVKSEQCPDDQCRWSWV